MKIGRFLAVLEAYGATPECWPDREREAALLLARTSVAAAQALAEARALDDALRAAEYFDIASEPHRFVMLKSRIIAAIQPVAESWFVRWLGFDVGPSRLWPSIVGLGLATVLGFAVGLSGFTQADSDNDESFALSAIDLPAPGSSQ